VTTALEESFAAVDANQSKQVEEVAEEREIENVFSEENDFKEEAPVTITTALPPVLAPTVAEDISSSSSSSEDEAKEETRPLLVEPPEPEISQPAFIPEVC